MPNGRIVCVNDALSPATLSVPPRSAVSWCDDSVARGLFHKPLRTARTTGLGTKLGQVQLVDPIGLMIGDAAENIGQPNLWIDSIELGSFDQRVGNSRRFSPTLQITGSLIFHPARFALRFFLHLCPSSQWVNIITDILGSSTSHQPSSAVRFETPISRTLSYKTSRKVSWSQSIGTARFKEHTRATIIDSIDGLVLAMTMSSTRMRHRSEHAKPTYNDRSSITRFSNFKRPCQRVQIRAISTFDKMSKP